MDKRTNINYEELADELIEWFKDEKNVYLKQFAVLKGFPASYISKYAKRSKYFEEKLALAKDIQESRLVKKMIGDNPSPSFAIFMLKNTAGWRDRFPDENEEKKVPTIKLVLKESKKEKKKQERKENKDQIKLFEDEKP
jgi:hypothetical protein